MASNVVTGIRRIVTGKSAFQQQKESREKAFESVRLPEGTTITETTSGPIF